jgi:hypothetical protein
VRQENIRSPGDRTFAIFELRTLQIYRVIECQGTINSASRDLPASIHLCEHSRLCRLWHEFWVNFFDAANARNQGMCIAKDFC